MTHDLSQKLAEAKGAIPELSDEQLNLLIVSAHRRRHHRRRMRVALGALLLVAAAGVGWSQLAGDQPMSFPDGSTATRTGRGSELRVAASTPSLIQVDLARGGGRFDVTHNPKRLFRVVAGDVVVDVLGTSFLVEREARRVHVRVERGRVRVTATGGERSLSQGQEDYFPSLGDAAPRAATLPLETAPLPHVEDELPAPTPQPLPASTRARGWRVKAEQGNYDAAFREIKAGGAQAVHDVPEELMLAADVARWSHHPSAAIPLLERVLREHRSDPRAQLAAFTLGRVFLDELGHPREAAQAFERARILDQDGPLAADALAREVEAWSRAGEQENAHARATEYEQRYPRGAHLRAVRQLGGLE